MISQRKTHQFVCIATWTGVLNDEACFLFFSFFFFFKHLIILPDDCVLNKHTCFSFAVLQYFYSFALFLLLLLFFFLPCLFLVLLYLFCSAFEVSHIFTLLLCRVFHLFIHFFILLKKIFFGGAIDVWVQHGSVGRVMGSETLNTSARLTLLTVPD